METKLTVLPNPNIGSAEDIQRANEDLGFIGSKEEINRANATLAGQSSTTDNSSYTTNFDVQAFQQSQLARAKTDLEAMAKSLAERETTTAGAAVSSDEPAVTSEKAALDTLDVKAGADPTRDALDLLSQEIARGEALLSQQERSINRSYDATKTSFQDKQYRETGETSAGIAAAGGYLGFSGSGQGVLLNLAKSHRDELLALEAQRQQALMEAREAAANRRFDLVKLKADEIVRIDDEIYGRQQDYFNNRLALQQEGRLQAQTTADINRLDMQTAQDTIAQIMETFGGGLKPEEMTAEYREKLEAMARQAGYSPEMLYKRLKEMPEVTMDDKDKTQRTNLMLDATIAGAPAEIIQKIASAETLADAAVLAQPYIKSQPKVTSTDKINYSGDSFYYDSERDQIENILRNSRVTAEGEETGYWASPEKYNEALQGWVAMNRNIGDFEDEFPVQLFIAPEDVETAPLQVREMYNSYEERKASLLSNTESGELELPPSLQ